MTTNEPSKHHINVDDLAREKVQEIEELLDRSDDVKLESVHSCFSILKQIITAADLHRTSDKDSNIENAYQKLENDESIYADFSDDNEQFNAVDLTEQFASNSVKWTIRVHAFKIVHRLMTLQNTHSIMLRHLPELVRLSFVAATSPYDDLKIQGFLMFKFLIEKFAFIEEKEFPGHSILEQYKTQVLSALKPAFNEDAPPYITAIASQVCCLWLCLRLEKEPINLKRTYQLMLLTIDKLENQSINQNSKLYTESELEQERLDILGSWAQLYVTASETDCGELSQLVKPEIGHLAKKFWEALRDYALLIMPAPRNKGSLHDDENVYTREVALKLFEPVWPKLILASSIWLCKKPTPDCIDQFPNKSKYLKFICGIILKELYRCYSKESTLLVLKSLEILVNNLDVQSIFVSDLVVTREFYVVLYNIYINSETRSDHCVISKKLLNLLFSTVAKKLSVRPKVMIYGLSRTTDSIVTHLDAIKKSARIGDISKFILSHHVHNMITLIGLSPEQLNNHDGLHDSVSKVLQDLVRTNEEFNLDHDLSDYLEDLYALPVPRLNESLFEAETNIVSNLLKLLDADEFRSKDDRKQAISKIELHLRLMRLVIGAFEGCKRLECTNKYIKLFVDLSLLNQIPDVVDAKTKNRKIELMALAVKHINELNIDTIDPELGQSFESAKIFLQDLRSKNEAKRNALNTKNQNISPVKPAKAPTKIVLKADFSNFYTKKN